MTAPIDVTGQRFGHLVAVERAGKDRCGSWMWLCRCDCGAEVVIGISRLRAANTVGCRLCAARRSRKNRYAQMIEDLEWILGTDHPESIARRLGYASADALITSLRRAGRDDLADRLMRANQRGDTIHRFGRRCAS